MTLPLMIFAAGKGTRMAPLTDVLPKPLIEVGGRSLLDRTLDLAQAAKVERIVVNIHHLGQQIRDHIGDQATISDESALLLETGGGLRKALPLLGAGPVITMNPDVVWTGPNPVSALLEAWNDDMHALLMLVPVGRAHGRQGGGDFTLGPDNHLIRKGDLIYGGVQIIRPDRLEEIPDGVFSLNRLWDILISEGQAYGLVHGGAWCDVGRPECIPLAEGLLGV